MEKRSGVWETDDCNGLTGMSELNHMKQEYVVDGALLSCDRCTSKESKLKYNNNISGQPERQEK